MEDKAAGRDLPLPDLLHLVEEEPLLHHLLRLLREAHHRLLTEIRRHLLPGVEDLAQVLAAVRDLHLDLPVRLIR
ncbi:hypothetical protein MSI_02230 [Treponema sp. JC4]|nr:hypothetical protein MSI_02230 [Treponema sp. JC4]